MAGLICIKTFLNRYEADLAKGLLESAGIEAAVSADDAGGMQPQLNLSVGVRLLVDEADADAALKILEDVEGESSED